MTEAKLLGGENDRGQMTEAKTTEDKFPRPNDVISVDPTPAAFLVTKRTIQKVVNCMYIWTGNIGNLSTVSQRQHYLPERSAQHTGRGDVPIAMSYVHMNVTRCDVFIESIETTHHAFGYSALHEFSFCYFFIISVKKLLSYL